MKLAGNLPVFNVPSGLIRILDRDLRAAGIPKRDDRGRVVDLHAMRTTFGTHLSKGGVPLRTAQAAMRHSKPELTANVYTDPRLLDIAGALDALPDLPLKNALEAQEAKAPEQMILRVMILPARLHLRLHPCADSWGKVRTLVTTMPNGARAALGEPDRL